MVLGKLLHEEGYLLGHDTCNKTQQRAVHVGSQTSSYDI
jgi:hypothetical protein